jgi:hypothetical protein
MSAMSEELTRWLSEQLDQDEEDVRRGYLKAEALPDYDGWDKSTTAGLPPIVAARVLREIDAKRGVLRQYEEVRQQVRHPVSAENRMRARVEQGALEDVLRLLVLPYADRPGCREEWRP